MISIDQLHEMMNNRKEHEHDYLGSISACCFSTVENKTNGDADWFSCDKCGENRATYCKECLYIPIAQLALDLYEENEKLKEELRMMKEGASNTY